ncbi:hypothetical protein AQUCO_03400112v1 [Aquilegia coerulea]|uniref:non-specific serine/threonine protein kinase n=1 Tax=Aquilegia coerulea TaxID=218851 RepID=A0A2G5CXI8_AQUCA|nr:hypothetical protein AQUCO_03400112v1 [Aquilegia coerulea]
MFQLFQLISVTVIIFDIFTRLVPITYASCLASSYHRCSNGFEIDYPFWFDSVSDTGYCGYPGLSLTCADEDGRGAMNISNHLYYVQYIDHAENILRVVDADIYRQPCPHPQHNVTLESTAWLDYSNDNEYITIFYNCTTYPRNVEQYNFSCTDNYFSSNSGRSYAFKETEIPKGFNWFGNCEESVVVPVSSNSFRYSNLTKVLQLGFDIRWSTPNDCNDCEHSDGSRGMCLYRKTTSNGLPVQCACGDDHKYLFDRTCPLNSTYLDEKKFKTASQGMPTGIKVIIGVSTGAGGLLLIFLFLIYRQKFCMLYYLMISHRKNKTESKTNVEVLLKSYGCLTLQRYRYSDIKKITNFFKDTLGQGAYGRVFKGKLDNGCLVAVKVLNESKGNGEEFVNEVATIGRTNHVNVVSLLGFCYEGTKRALVYEYMPNGSLEKFIYNEKISSTGSSALGWEKLYQIALGIARGLEYLHRGCNTRILHFDIKPHNILLDQDFCPKISDFGLAKLCPTRESIVSMVGARGTIGYIAPEVYCRNFGGVSHKSDVYSYGMMVLEMIGGRKNIDATMNNNSEVYFPHWIYNHLKLYIKVEGTVSIKIEGSGETFENEAAKKMIIVALWCIQTHPVDRPSISNVVEMLEGQLEDLLMPPNPFQEPPSRFSPSSSINVV